MENVARNIPKVQMPTNPKDRVRASIALTVVPEIAERLLQWCKANPAFKLADLRDDDERAIFYSVVCDHLFTMAALDDVIARFNALRAQGHAIAESDTRATSRQARQDIRKYGRGTGSVN